jgi:hypothetical protein
MTKFSFHTFPTSDYAITPLLAVTGGVTMENLELIKKVSMLQLKNLTPIILIQKAEITH